jgi:hypothetical protein
MNRPVLKNLTSPHITVTIPALNVSTNAPATIDKFS